MESLMSAQIKLNPIHAVSQKQKNSVFVPSLNPSRTRRAFASPAGVLRNSKSFNSVAATFQPLESSVVGRFDNTLPTKDVLDVWRSADAVCFDVDSTVCLDEGIDELADFCGAGQAVAEWTARAMSGSVPFEEALAARLSLFNPSLAQVQDFLAKKPPRISPGIDILVKKLMDKNVQVYLISGGFRQMINGQQKWNT